MGTPKKMFLILCLLAVYTALSILHCYVLARTSFMNNLLDTNQNRKTWITFAEISKNRIPLIYMAWGFFKNQFVLSLLPSVNSTLLSQLTSQGCDPWDPRITLDVPKHLGMSYIFFPLLNGETMSWQIAYEILLCSKTTLPCGMEIVEALEKGTWN